MKMDGSTIVLGWDGLDYQLSARWGMLDRFGPYSAKIDTYDNQSIGEPHTWELWPTLITGLGPDEHGVVHSTEDKGVDWNNPLIQLGAAVAAGVVPQSVRTEVGRWLRNRGAGLSQHGPAYYRERGVETIFDERTSRPISIPNYYTDFDEAFGLTFDRGTIFKDYVDKRTAENSEVWEPAVSQSILEARLATEAMKRAGIVRSAIERDYDIVWAWFGIVDTVGHLNPSLEEPLQRRVYDFVAEITEWIEDVITPDDTLVVVSDHGLREGTHTHDPIFASNVESIVDEVDSVFDVAPILNAHTRESNRSPNLRDPWDRRPHTRDSTMGEVKESLEDLGYI